MEELEEIWKPIKKYNEYYISNYGRVYNITKQEFVPVKNNFIYVSKVKKGKRHHATLSVKRLLFEYFNINEYAKKPKKITFLSNYYVKKNQKRAKGKPIDINFYNTIEELENEYGCIEQIPNDDERLKTLWSYFN